MTEAEFARRILEEREARIRRDEAMILAARARQDAEACEYRPPHDPATCQVCKAGAKART